MTYRALDRRIAEHAQRIVWNDDVRPKDAIHVATALSLRAAGVAIEQFDTFDKALVKRSGMLGDPPLTIGRPNLPAQLSFGESDLP